VPAYVDLGDTYEKLAKREKALEQYGKALTLDKHNWRVREMLKRIGELK
jgi:tetratricopeptide (TPR) repeat protein